FREFLNGGTFDQADRFQFARSTGNLQTARDALFQSAHIGRWNDIAIKPAALSICAFAAASRAPPRPAPAGIGRWDVSSLRRRRFTRRAGIFHAAAGAALTGGAFAGGGRRRRWCRSAFARTN